MLKFDVESTTNARIGGASGSRQICASTKSEYRIDVGFRGQKATNSGIRRMTDFGLTDEGMYNMMFQFFLVSSQGEILQSATLIFGHRSIDSVLHFRYVGTYICYVVTFERGKHTFVYIY